MPITYRIDQQSGIVFREHRGEITRADFEAHWRAMLADPELPPGDLYLFADMRESRLVITGDEVSRLVRETVAPLLAGRRWRSAIVVGTPVQFGITNQFIVYAQDLGDTATFFEIKDAVDWLIGVPPSKDVTAIDRGPLRPPP